MADARQRYLIADNRRSFRASCLNSLLLRPLNDAVQPVEVAKTPSAGITLEQAWTTAETESPEIRVIDAEIQEQVENLKSIRAEYLPDLFLQGGYQHQDNSYVVHEDNWSMIAGLTSTFPPAGLPAQKWPRERQSFQLCSSPGSRSLTQCGLTSKTPTKTCKALRSGSRS